MHSSKVMTVAGIAKCHTIGLYSKREGALFSLPGRVRQGPEKYCKD